MTGFRHRIEHVDTDAAGVVHFSRYVSLMETAVLDFLEEHDAGLTTLAGHGVQLAVTELQVRYRRSCAYRDLVLGEPVIEHVHGARFGARVALFRQEAGGARTDLASGHLMFAAVDLRLGRAAPLPPLVRHTLKGLATDADLPAESREPAAGEPARRTDPGLLRAQAVVAAPASDDLPRPDPRP
jgi:acyl-CoA thioester hydrolase